MIVIIDYGVGNLHSVLKSFKILGVEAVISSKIEDIEKADKLVLPGVGHFKKGMDNLREIGLINILNKKVLKEKTPILGICLGMQLFTKFSEEGNVKGLGWFDANTVKLKSDSKFRVPHIGWNNIIIHKDHPLFGDVGLDESFYFVHSFYVVCNNKADVLSTTKYGKMFSSAIQKDNIIGTQFHPEKSYKGGLQILKNFVEKI